MATKKTKETKKSSGPKVLFGEPIITEQENVKMKSNDPTLWDMVNMLFTKPHEFSKLSTYEKGKNFFMMQRIFAIKYPLQASALNHLRISGGHVISFWCDTMQKLYVKQPDWIWKAFKSIKTTKTLEQKKFDVTEDTMLYYCQKHQCSRRELNEAIAKYPDEMLEELKFFEKNM